MAWHTSFDCFVVLLALLFLLNALTTFVNCCVGVVVFIVRDLCMYGPKYLMAGVKIHLSNR